ncbi:hypothetical protein CEW88_19705 (plasmid) [Alloyangia pacifica]|uniref:Uncharacterized protein n=1 Tax=Alloyangia pacifica TaxID=311180 RepID=A0A2U8HKA5_9RHOB|nr:hypothetical protein CEW88_19705 [Alloyangia pacifica]
MARGLAAGGPDLGTALDLKQLLRRQGFYMDEAGWQRLAADQALYPQLSYVPNMNGGSPQESLEFRGLTFDLRDDLVARGGLAVGATYDGLLRYGWDSGRYLQLQAQLGGLYAPGPDLDRTRARLALCSRNHLTDWQFVDLCLSHYEDHRDLQDITRDEATVSVSTLFERSASRHEVGLSLSRRSDEDRLRSLAEVGLESVWAGSATRLSFEYGAPTGDETGALLTAAGEIRWPAAGQVVGLGLSLSRSPKTLFLGEDRRDDSLGVTGLLAIDGRLVLTAAYGRTWSTVNFFEDEVISFGVSYSLP